MLWTDVGFMYPKGNVGVVVDDYKFDIYERVGNALFSTYCGLVHVCGHYPNQKGRFGNATIKLRIKEPSVIFPKITATRVHIFEGVLWDSHSADQQVAKHLETQIYNIGVKRSRDYSRGCYSSVKATAEFMSIVSEVVVMGKPVQGDFNDREPLRPKVEN